MNIAREELGEIIELDMPVDGVTVPGGSHPIQVGEDDVAEIGRR